MITTIKTCTTKEFNALLKDGAIELIARDTMVTSYADEKNKVVNRYYQICFFEKKWTENEAGTKIAVKGKMLGSCTEEELGIKSWQLGDKFEMNGLAKSGQFQKECDKRQFAVLKDDTIYFCNHRGNIQNIDIVKALTRVNVYIDKEKLEKAQNEAVKRGYPLSTAGNASEFIRFLIDTFLLEKK